MYLNGYRCSVDHDSGSLCTPHDASGILRIVGIAITALVISNDI